LSAYTRQSILKTTLFDQTEFGDLMTTIAGLVIIAVLIVMANQQQANAKTDKTVTAQPDIFLRSGWYIIAGFILFIGFNALVALLVDDPSALSADVTIPDIAFVPGVLLVGLSLLAGLSAIMVIRSRQARVFLRDKLIRPTSKPDQKRRTYEPDNPVHTTAVLLMLLAVVNTIGSFVLAGGWEGLAENIQANEPRLLDLALSLVLYTSLALLGAGLFVRRNLQQVIERLSLRLPTRDDWRMGLLAGVGLYVLQIAVGIVWVLLSDPETLQQQTAAAEQIFRAFSGSLLAGFFLALSASIGEEILFRGALQPVFGLWITSIFFALLHTQYTLTPASIIIFGVALGLGWIRRKYSTTAAIIGHFVYNFIPFMFLQLDMLLPETQSILFG
jgi:membrane protease YdiL (CAAX protease family)